MLTNFCLSLPLYLRSADTFFSHLSLNHLILVTSMPLVLSKCSIKFALHWIVDANVNLWTILL